MRRVDWLTVPAWGEISAAEGWPSHRSPRTALLRIEAGFHEAAHVMAALSLGAESSAAEVFAGHRNKVKRNECQGSAMTPTMRGDDIVTLAGALAGWLVAGAIRTHEHRLVARQFGLDAFQAANQRAARLVEVHWSMIDLYARALLHHSPAPVFVTRSEVDSLPARLRRRSLRPPESPRATLACLPRVVAWEAAERRASAPTRKPADYRLLLRGLDTPAGPMKQGAYTHTERAGLALSG